MALIKQPVNINFSQGVNTKVDPFQLPIGQFQALQNSIFDKAGRLTKRNGYGPLTILPNATTTFLTTFNGDLTAIGTSLQAFNASNQTWVNKGAIQPLSLETLPLIRSNTNQSQADSAVAPGGLVCTVYTDNLPSGASYRYAIADSTTGQNIVAPTVIPVTSGVVTGSARAFVLGPYFIILFTNVIAAVAHLQYVAISIAIPTLVTVNADIASSYVPAPTLSFDGVVLNNKLYIAYDTLAGGQSVKITSLSSNLVLAAAHTFVGQIATMMSLTVDNSNPNAPVVWAAYYDLVSLAGAAFAVDPQLNVLLAPTAIITGETVLNLTSIGLAGRIQIFYEINHFYGYDGAIRTNFIRTNTITQLGVVGTPANFVLSVGLASKAFLINNMPYFLAVYSSPYQPSYFLLNANAQVVAKLAYSNGGGYYLTGLPGVSVSGEIAQVSYLIKDLIAATNKTQGLPTVQTTPVYSQTGINLATFDVGGSDVITLSSEIASNLSLTGGFIAGYDGYSIVENGFFLWPDSVEVTTATGSGNIPARQYFYVATYEWSDNQGNVFRSAPSIPVGIVTTTTNSTNTINVPTLRLTYKLANPVKIVVYRWSAAQQNYYALFAPSVAPTLNNTAVDFVTITDTFADASIIGNPLLYTTGGVIENISPPSSSIMTLFNNRLWIVDAEDTNLLWYSKQVIENTPVDMSDLLTLYVAPTTGSQGSTGPVTALAPMDDKLIIFKKDALGYINGIGPDNTGANSQYSDFILINSVVGCTNERSIVFTPSGLMFQSDKGIWLLGRDLSTVYIGAPVESLTTGATIQSALNIPTTNQVRFTLDTGITLMYDYFYSQWGTFVNVPAVSSTIYKSLHTYVNRLGQVFQETPGKFLDNTSPVFLSFTTGWLNLAGLQGFERFYHMFLLGQYITPFKLDVQMAYDYNPSLQQSTIVSPLPPTSNYGGDSLYGSSDPYGGPSNVFEARVFPQIQKCESFQLVITEMYDPSFGIAAGAGLTLSGLNILIGTKKGSRTSPASRNFG